MCGEERGEAARSTFLESDEHRVVPLWHFL